MFATVRIKSFLVCAIQWLMCSLFFYINIMRILRILRCVVCKISNLDFGCEC